MLYIDGYGAHWDATALNILLDSGIYVTFLRSQNPENDQPNNHGPNCRLKALYAADLASFMATDSSRRVQKFQHTHFNHCFKEVWELFSSGRCCERKKNAFKNCGLFALSLEAAWEHQRVWKQAGGIISTEAPSSVSVRKSLRFLVFDYWITSKLTDDVHIATKALQSAMFEDVGNTHVKEFRARDLMGTFTSACARNYKSSLLSRTIIRYWCAVW